MMFIYGEETYLINQEIEKIIKKSNSNPVFINANYPIERIVEELNTYSFDGKNKLLFIVDHALMNNDKISRILIEELDTLDSTISVNIISKMIHPKKTSLLFKWYQNRDKVKEFEKLSSTEIRNFIFDYVNSKGGEISSLMVKKLIEFIPNDLSIIKTELDKAMSFNKIIEELTIDSLITKYELNDEFAIPNAIVGGDYNKLIKNYNYKLSKGQNPLNIMNQISDILIIASTIYAFKNAGYSNNDITNETKIHPYRIKLVSQLLKSSSINKIRDCIKLFGDYDYQIKRGLVTPRVAMDNFIINYIK